MPARTKGAATSVKVRMYRHGFGDCFLLSFFEKTQRIFSVLIDCGIKYNTKSTEVPISDVIDDLTLTLTPEEGGKPVIDVLVATHEHWDHISFFHPTRGGNPFKDFDIKQVWLAWTENPNDEEAKVINSRLRNGSDALQLAAARLRDAEEEELTQVENSFLKGEELTEARSAFNEQISDVLGFYGAASSRKKSENDINYKPNGRVSKMTEAAIKNIVDIGKNGGTKYLLPGTLVDKAAIPDGLNVYVLGPPKNSMINKSNPSRGDAHETYFGIDSTGMGSFVDGMLGMNGGRPGCGGDSGSPFSSEIGVGIDCAAKDAFWEKHYFNAENEEYRRIENNWLDLAAQFSLQLDRAVNNTSLVLAFELKDSGKILLFPGDAQVGSWLSWHDYIWEVKDENATTKERNAEDLLKNTVLYKVSHHGSHNATIKDKGLEMMTHEELVAMMPEKEESYRGIPHPPLMERLNELCKGRVLVSADVNFPPENLRRKAHKPPQMSEGEWQAFKENLTVKKCYVEYTIE